MVDQRAAYSVTPGRGLDSNEMEFDRLGKVPKGEHDADHFPRIDSDSAHEIFIACC